MKTTSLLFRLQLLALLMTCGSGIKVDISNNVTGIEGTSWTIESSYTRENVYRFISANFQKKINNTFKTLIRFFFDREVDIRNDGYYLRGRVSFDNITQSSNKVVVNFTNLLCIDQGEYRYLIYFENNDGTPDNNFSESTYIDVEVLPSKPAELSVMKINETDQEDSTNINESNNLVFVENDTITAFCGGEVGKPPANLTMQKIYRNGTSYNLIADNDPVNATHELPNCSFYQNNSFKADLTDQDNGTTLRCAVKGNGGLFKETGQIIVLFPVRIPVINLDKNESNGMPPLTLQCYGRGNPEPDYTWFKLNVTANFEFYASAQNITLNSTADRGVYRCDVNNSIDNKVYRESSNITFTFEVETTATVSTTVLTSTQATSTESTNKDNNNELLDKGIYIGLGVLGVIIIIVIIVTVCVKMRAKKPDENLVHSLGTMEKIGTDNYYDIDLQTRKSRNPEDVRKEIEDTKKHNESYLKDQAADNSQVNQQPVEYAAVNKPKKGAPYQNTHIHQPAEYAQVNKLSRKTSSEPPPDYDDDPYASGQGIYDHANDRRHKKMQDTENYDTAASVTKGKSAKHQTNLGSVVDPTAEPLKQGHVASDRQSRTITKLESNLAEKLESKTSL